MGKMTWMHLMGAPLGGSGTSEPTATFTVTTTGAQTLALGSLSVAAGKTVTVDWGDNTSNDYTGEGTRTHNYADAGVWTVTIQSARHVTQLNLQDTKITSLNSADIKDMALTYLYLSLSSATTGTFNSADIKNMPLTTLHLYLPATTGTFNSADIASMALTYLRLSLFSSAVIFNSADIKDMAFTTLNLTQKYNSTATIAREDWAGVVVRAVVSPTIQLGLSQTQVDALLLGIHDAAPNRIASAGTLSVGGTNAAPSGTLQAECPPTTGKAAAYELVNDSCGVIPAGKEYAAVTINS